MNTIQKICKLLTPKNRTIVITGAGFSACTGLRTFRGADGLYKDPTVREKYRNVKPEYLLSIEGFKTNPVLVNSFYRDFFLDDVEPGESHKLLKELEDIRLVQGIIA